MGSDSFLNYSISILDDPKRLWMSAFERQLNDSHRALLLVLVTCPSRVGLDDLQTCWNAYLDNTGVLSSGRSFHRSLSTLEGGFISVNKVGDFRFISFSNPSIIDFVCSYIDQNPRTVSALIDSIMFFEQIVNLCRMSTNRLIYRHEGGFFHGQVGSARIEGVLHKRSEELKSVFTNMLDSDEFSVSSSGRKPSPSTYRRLAMLLDYPEDWWPGRGVWEPVIFELVHLFAGGELIYEPKDTIVRLYNEMVRVGFVGEDLLAEFSAALSEIDNWNSSDPEDWQAMLKIEGGMTIFKRAKLKDQFVVFLEEELLQDEPYDLEELRTLAEEFGVESEFELEFQSAEERLENEDHSSEALGGSKESQRVSGSSKSEDSEIRAMFGCFQS